jgi:predicted N-acetyltransferase YhbS
MDTLQENVIEFLKTQDVMTCTFSRQKFITRTRKLAEKYPDEVQIVAENEDGSIVAHIPVSYLKISRIKPNFTEEQREGLRTRMYALHKTRADSTKNNPKNGF